VFVISLPPLREREGDLELLSKFFLERFNRELDRSVQGISDEAITLIHRYNWPGNVRELQNTIKSAVILADQWILPQHLPTRIINAAGKPQAPQEASTTSNTKQAAEFPTKKPASRRETLKSTSKQAVMEAERELIVTTLQICRWNKAKAARQLGVDYKTLYNKIKTYRITWEHS